MSLGRNTITNNMSEFACGQDNVSNKASNTYSDSGNTLFSVGNGVFMSTRHNAFEIRQNGDIYIADTNDTSTTNYYEKPMIKLQDALGGGGGMTSGDVQTMIDESISGKTNQNDNLFTIRTNVIETVILTGGKKFRIIFAFDIIQNNQIVLSTDTVNDKSSSI